MNAPTAEATLHPAWMEAVMAAPMDEDDTPAASAEDSSDQWVSEVLTECYN